MLYKTDIANMALGRLGVSSTITDLETEYSTEANIIKRHFRTSLNDILEQHYWNFARRSAQLILQFSNPEPGYAYSYHMPADSLIPRQIAQDEKYIKNFELYPDQKIPFQEIIIGTTRLIYTNLANAWMEYTALVEENSVFPSHFGKGFAAQLSIDIAPSLITNNYPKIKNALNSEAENAISKSIADDLVRQPQFTNAASSLVRCRY